MKTFEFSIIASGLDPEADDFEARFYGHGCDDATVSFQKGHIIVDFGREAERIDDAISSAVLNVAGTGAKVERVEPDPLVSLTDIATRTNMTKSAMSLYAQGKRKSGFPAPSLRITSTSPLWNWPDVAEWLFRHDKLSKDDAIAAVAVEQANEVLETSGTKDIAPELKRRVHAYEEALAD